MNYYQLHQSYSAEEEQESEEAAIERNRRLIEELKAIKKLKDWIYYGSTKKST